jgi:hypothetical protein
VTQGGNVRSRAHAQVAAMQASAKATDVLATVDEADMDIP